MDLLIASRATNKDLVHTFFCEVSVILPCQILAVNSRHFGANYKVLVELNMDWLRKTLSVQWRLSTNPPVKMQDSRAYETPERNPILLPHNSQKNLPDSRNCLESLYRFIKRICGEKITLIQPITEPQIFQELFL